MVHNLILTSLHFRKIINACYVVLQLDFATLYSNIFSCCEVGKLRECLSQILCTIIGRERRK